MGVFLDSSAFAERYMEGQAMQVCEAGVGACCVAAVLLYASLAAADSVKLSPQSRDLAGWRFTNGPEFPGAKGSLRADKSGVLRVRYDFRGGGAYVGAWLDLDPPRDLNMIRFRVRKPAEAELTFRIVDSSGQGLQERMFYDHTDWQAIEVDMLNWDYHFGGANDGLLHPPVRGIGILVERKGLESLTGEVLIADVTVETGASETGRVSGDLRARYQVTDFGVDAPLSGPIEAGVWRAPFDTTASSTLGSSLSLLGSPAAFTLKVRGGRPGNILKMQLGSHFQVFQYTVGILDGAEKNFVFPAPPKGWEFFGGQNDGEVRLPLRLSALVLDRGDGPAEPTEVQLVSLECTTEVERNQVLTALSSVSPPRTAGAAATLDVTVTARSLLDKPASGTLTFTMRDWDRNVLKESRSECTIPPLATPFVHTVSCALDLDCAFAEFEFAFTAPEGSFNTKAYWTKPLEDPGEPVMRPESPWGMGVYLYRYPHNPEGHTMMGRAAALAQAAGVKWSREEFSWANTEPKQGEYDFAFYDLVVDTARRHGISVYGLLSYWSNWTQPYTQQGIEDFARWAKAVVGHFKDRVKHWEVYNEPNIFFWQGPRELYPVLMKKCYDAIKEVDPDAQVLAISTAGIDNKFIQLCLDAGAPFDILTVHPYRAHLSERVLIKELRDTREQVSGRPLWITEMGWSTQVGGRDERTQAELLARCYLTSVASGACQNVSWYDFRNDGEDPFYNEANFGVLRHDFTPKPAYRALATVCRTMAHGAPRARTDFGEGIYALEMGDAIALWSPRKGFRLPCRLEPASATVLNLMGERLTPTRVGKKTMLILRAGQPIFVQGARVRPAGRARPFDEPVDNPPLRF